MHSISYEERKMVVIILHRMRVANKCDIRRLTQPEPREETFNKGKMNYLCFYLISVTILFFVFLSTLVLTAKTSANSLFIRLVGGKK